MRMTYFPVLEEIKDEYIRLRQNGNGREETAEMLMESYADELQDPNEYEAQLFWIGLADAQYYQKELSEDIAARALNALEMIGAYNWNVCPSDLVRRREHYAKAPMAERKVGKPKPKFRCEWRIGDTFAYQLTSREATELGIGGKYMLLRKVSEVEFDDGSLYPIVAVSLWDSEELPSSTKQYETASLLKLCRGGRNFSPPNCFEYRTEILIKNRNQLGLAPLIFVGNFSQSAMPSDEVIFTRGGDILMMLLETIEKDLCRFWRINKRILSSMS